MKRKLVSAFLLVTMSVGMLTGCGGSSDAAASEDGASAEAASGDGVSITMLNTKSEIQSQLEEVAATYEDITGVHIDVYAANGDSPSQEIAKQYASGDAPTLIMADPQDVIDIAAEKAVPLDGEEWVQYGADQYGIKVDDTLYSFPLCVEARGLVYNKTAIEDVTGKDFDPAAITNLDDLKALLEELKAGGMETPVALNKEDWSLAGHYLTQVYEEQDGTEATAVAFTDSLMDGSAKAIDNARFNSLMDTFDVLKEYNMNSKDALAANYDNNAIAVAEGDIAFWFNGNWAWGNMVDYIDEDTEYGIMPVPQDSTEGNENVNDYLCGGTSKQIMIDNVCSSEEQQQAAKDFLTWLDTDEEGQDFLVNQCSLVPALNNIELEISDPLGSSVQKYASEGKIFEAYTNLPGDHWKEMGISMQKYLGGEIDRTELGTEIDTYWQGLSK